MYRWYIDHGDSHRTIYKVVLLRIPSQSNRLEFEEAILELISRCDTTFANDYWYYQDVNDILGCYKFCFKTAHSMALFRLMLE